jgi:hypothetical protein
LPYTCRPFRAGGFSFAGALLNIGEAISTKHPAVVHSTYRPKRARKRKQSVAIPMRIVTAKPPKKHLGGRVQRIGGVQEPVPEMPRIVSAKKPRGRFGDVPDMSPEEHQQRGDAAEALFREIVRRARGITAPRPPWRSYGDDPLPDRATALAAPLRAFPRWYLRMECAPAGGSDI